MTLRIASRPSDVPTPAPAQPLDEDLVAVLQRPYDRSTSTDGSSLLTSPASDPGTRDRLLAYAYAVYDASVTHQLPPGSVPSEHGVLLQPLLELLHRLHPYHPPIALLLGCVYSHHDLTQRSLQINRSILQYDPHNVRSHLLSSSADLGSMMQVLAMCNVGVDLWTLNAQVDAFGCWWRALQLSPTNWDILVGIL